MRFRKQIERALPIGKSKNTDYVKKKRKEEAKEEAERIKQWKRELGIQNYTKFNPMNNVPAVDRRKKRIKEQTPPSSSPRLIRKIYRECRIISIKTGIPHHVDHINPLALGGLHHQDNMQIIPDNLEKSSRNPREYYGNDEYKERLINAKNGIHYLEYYTYGKEESSGCDNQEENEQGVQDEETD